MVAEFESVSGIVGRDHTLVQFFTGPNANHFGFAGRVDGGCDIQNGGARNLGNEDFASLHSCECFDDEINCFLKGDDEPGHFGIGNREHASLSLFLKEWNDGSIAAPDVAVADD